MMVLCEVDENKWVKNLIAHLQGKAGEACAVLRLDCEGGHT